MGKALYRILTDGKEVAGMKNPGKDEIIELSDAQAEHPLRIGHIENAVKDQAPAIETPPPAKKLKGSSTAVGDGEATGTLTITE